MVTIVNFKVEKSFKGDEYIRFILQSDDLNIVTTDSGSQYANAPKASIISTVSEVIAKSQLGKQLPGSIERVRVDPYTYKDTETGEERTLNFRYFYIPEVKPKEAEEEAIA